MSDFDNDNEKNYNDYQDDAIDSRSAFSCTPLPRLVDDETAKQQRMDAMEAAHFDYNELKEKISTTPEPIAANDSWPLIEQLNRSVFEQDAAKRQKYIAVAYYMRELIKTAHIDPIGVAIHRPGKEPTLDFDADRTKDGKVLFHYGQSLDRKARTYNSKDGEAGARRFDGPARKSTRSEPVSNGFQVNQDDPLALRCIDAKNKIEDLRAVVGPLWSPLLWAVRDKANFTEIAKLVGYNQPVVGSALVKLALEVASKQIEALHAATDFRSYVAVGLPIAPYRYERAVGPLPRPPLNRWKTKVLQIDLDEATAKAA